MEKRLTVSRTGGQTSALLWLYTCEGAPLVSVYIDDETGCLVRLSAETDARAEPGAYPKMAEAWRIFLSEYYGFELLPGYAEEGVRVGGDGGSLERYLFPLLLDMGNGQPLRLNLALYGPKYLRVSFNAFYPDGFDAALMPE